MKKLLYVLVFSLLLQSCYSYKTVSLNETKTGKKYEIQMTKGQKVEGKLVGESEENISLYFNENTVEFPKDKIASIKRKKTSVIFIAAIVAAVTAGVIILINDAPVSDDLISQLPEE